MTDYCESCWVILERSPSVAVPFPTVFETAEMAIEYCIKSMDDYHSFDTEEERQEFFSKVRKSLKEESYFEDKYELEYFLIETDLYK